jgi:amidophosphoribosyltransferase
MCGIVGLFSNKPVSEPIIYGLGALQHRGQDAAGVVTFDGRFHTRKGTGLVAEVFRQAADREDLVGHLGLGHARYATQGSTALLDAQPLTMNYPFGIAMIHNGNVTNFESLRTELESRHQRVLDTTNDLELLLYTLAEEIGAEAETKPGGFSELGPAELFAAVARLRQRVEGAYSVLAIVAHKGLLAFRDDHGIRPLLYAHSGADHAFASESAVFDCLGMGPVRDVGPGETVFIDMAGVAHVDAGTPAPRSAFCSFEHIYFAREDALFSGRRVASARLEMGRLLASAVQARGLLPDVVIDVPSSAYFAAAGLAEALGVPYRRGLTKNNHIGRSFIVPSALDRARVVRQKLNPIPEVVAGRRVAVVDDSIVRGTTSRHIIRLLREAGAAAVYMVSAAPPLRHPCPYGIDIARRAELVAAMLSHAELEEALGADAVVYPAIDDFKRLFADQGHCFACFDGDYPTAVTDETRRSIEREQVASGRRQVKVAVSL